MASPVAFSSIPNPGETPNPSAPGTNIYSFQELETYNPEAVLYAALGNQDRNIRLKTLVDYILANVQEGQIPTDVVRRAEMESYVAEMLETLVIPDQEITDANLAEKVNGLETIINLTQEIAELNEKVETLDPPDMAAYVKVAPGTQRGKPLILDPNGDLTHRPMAAPIRVVYVVKRTTPLTNPDGSRNAPYDTIQDAIDGIGTSVSNSVILVQPSQSANYPGFTVDGRNNITVMGCGCTDSHAVRIDGAVVNKGEGTRFRLKDVQLRQTDPNVPVYTNEGTLGRDYFKNVTMEMTSSSQTTPLVHLKNVRNWIDFEDCNMSGIVLIDGTAGPSALVAIRTANAEKMAIELNSKVKVVVNHTFRIGNIKQTDGEVEVNHVHGFIGKDGVAIDSQGGSLSVNYTDLYRGDTSLKLVRGKELTPALLNHTSVDPVMIDGPVKFKETDLLAYQLRPEFTLEADTSVPGERKVKVQLTQRKGYYYVAFEGKVLQVGEDGDVKNPLAVTPFVLVDGSTELEVEKAPNATQMYLHMHDVNSLPDEGFLYGPFPN